MFLDFMPEIMLIIASFITALLLSVVSIPPVIALAKGKSLLDKPNGRSVHKFEIPTLGGIAIFAGFMFSSLVFACMHYASFMPVILAACLLIFFVGMKDDMFVLSARKKFITQIFAAIVVVVIADLRITNLHGAFGVDEINYLWSIIVSVFVIVAVTNAINLIDGIDGLAAFLSAIASLTFGSWFYMAGEITFAVLCFSLAGAIVGFIPYNLSSSEKYKIFMGDTGSLLCGFILGCIAIGFNEANLVADSHIKISSAPAVSIGILFFPLFDTIRVMIIRIFKKTSPFKADRRHVHHILLYLGHSHIRSTIILSFYTIVFIVISFLLQDIGVIYLIIVQTLLGVLLYITPITFMLRRFNKRVKRNIRKINMFFTA